MSTSRFVDKLWEILRGRRRRLYDADQLAAAFPPPADNGTPGKTSRDGDEQTLTGTTAYNSSNDAPSCEEVDMTGIPRLESAHDRVRQVSADSLVP
ncbi:hypothetical protein GFS60_03235 [Rhodococcus sp. WAY2]|nr:hypothetical protein GFS60_03235 [Rhodococcus sp. WAY2]